MGVPTFYRWLSCRYPRVVTDVGPNHAEDIQRETEETLRRDQANQEEPLEEGEIRRIAEETRYDCLYLDMNGIIHPCCHSDDGASPPTEGEMHEAIFAYIDRLVGIVRPRLLLYMAIGTSSTRFRV
ncbi:hypothetical protein Emed_002428 [Eimeria media]